MKKEIYCGFDIVEFNRIRDALDNAKIKHITKVIDLIMPSCLAGEMSGVRTAARNAPTKQYYVYVSNDDFEKASIMIRKGR